MRALIDRIEELNQLGAFLRGCISRYVVDAIRWITDASLAAIKQRRKRQRVIHHGAAHRVFPEANYAESYHQCLSMIETIVPRRRSVDGAAQ